MTPRTLTTTNRDATRPEVAIPTLRIVDVAAAIARSTIVEGVGETISPGEKVALIGANGSGKSTLLRTLVGITRPAAGAVLLDENPLHAMRARARAQQVSYVAQQEHPPAEMIVREAVAMGRNPHRSSWHFGAFDDRELVETALQHVDLLDRIDCCSAELSGGELRRVVIARGLVQSAPIFTLDEPTNHLDIQWQHTIARLLAEYSGTVVAAMHDLELVLQYFTKVIVLQSGAVIASGPPRDVLTTDLIRTVYNVTADRLTTSPGHREHIVVRPHRSNHNPTSSS